MSSGFITESEIEAAKNKRQEEWDKVRTADDPIDAPEPTYDARSLYERLQEQKQKRELEYEEAHKLKNMIKGLDDDEIEFLDLVDKTKMAVDRKKMIEEEKELKDYRNRVATLQEQDIEKKKQTENSTVKPKTQVGNKNTQTKLLKGAVVTKTSVTKRKLSDSESKLNSDDKSGDECNSKLKSNEGRNFGSCITLAKTKKRKLETNNCLINNNSDPKSSVMKCIGVLPGMGYYSSSSSDESSDYEPDFKLADVIHKSSEKKDKKGEKSIK